MQKYHCLLFIVSYSIKMNIVKIVCVDHRRFVNILTFQTMNIYGIHGKGINCMQTDEKIMPCLSLNLKYMDKIFLHT